MTEADLTVEADKLFREMGMVDLPHDALDFFQNSENGASSDWKKCLKGPVRGARRTSSDGVALVHLKKKYSTGLVQDQQQTTRNIKASDIDSSTILPRKLTPSTKIKARFGYSTAKVADSSAVNKSFPAEVKPVAPASSCSEEGANKPTTRPHNKAPPAVVGRHRTSTMPASPKPGCISTHRPINTNLTVPLGNNQLRNSEQTAISLSIKQERPNSAASNGVHNSMLATNYTQTHMRSRSHSSVVATATNFLTPTSSGSSKKTTEGEKARSIERKPSEGEEARSTERKTTDKEKAISKTPEGEKPRLIERKILSRERAISIEKKPSEGEKGRRLIERKSLDREKLISVERKIPEREKARLIERKSLSREKAISIERQPLEGEKARSTRKKTLDGDQIERKTPEKETSNTASVSENKHQFVPAPSQASPAELTAGTSNVKTGSPDRVRKGGEKRGGSHTQVLHSSKSSFKLFPVSSSSHRIMHVIHDGGPPKRHNSLNRRPLPLSLSVGCFYHQGLAKSASIRPPLDNTTLRQEKSQDHQSQSSAAGHNIMIYHSFDNNAIHEIRIAKDTNVSQAQRRGGCDLSSAPALSSMATQKEEPVSNNVEDISSIAGDTRCAIDAESCADDPAAMKSLEPTSGIGTTKQSSIITQSLMKCTPPTTSRTSPVGVPMSNEIVGKEASKENGGHNSSAPTSSENTTQGKLSHGKATKPMPRNLPDEKPVRQLSWKKKGRKTSAGPLVQSLSPPKITLPTNASSNINRKTHRPLQASLSDTSTILSTRTLPEISVESVEGGFCSSVSSTNTSSVPELNHKPLSECRGALMGSMERQAKLELNWSNQSLNENMKNVATTTVAALGNLVDVLTAPPTLKLKDSRELRYSTEEDTPTNVKWYLETEDEDNYRSSSLSNPHSPVSSTTSPTFMSESYFLSNVKSRGNSNPPKDRREINSASPLGVPMGTSRPDRDTSRKSSQITSNERSGSQIQRGSQIDGSIMSRIPSRRRTAGSSKPSKLSAPPVPPKPDMVQQLTSSTSPEEYYFKSKTCILVPNKTSSLSSSTSSSSYYSYRRPQSRCSSSEPSDTECRIMLRTSEEQRGPDARSRLSAYSEPSMSGDTSELANPLDHDYAILEPSSHLTPVEHDYAILDPEYHDEFYGYCMACSEPIIGMENGCLALERTFHTKCFTCSTCGICLRGCNFYTFQGKFLCEKEVTYERCQSCRKNIHSQVIKALGFAYHPKCFKCTVCECCLDGVHYASDSWNKLYCIQDYHKMFSRKCVVCDHPIVSENGHRKSLQVIAMDKSYHIQCYKCEDCHQQLASRTGGGEKCYPLNGHLLCKTCNTLRVQIPESYRTPALQRESITSH